MKAILYLAMVLLTSTTQAQTITWSQVPGLCYGATAFAQNSLGTKLYKSSSSSYGAMMSIDQGLTWTSISPYNTGATGIIVKGDTLVVPFLQCNSLVGLHYTVDDGQNWVNIGSVGSGAYDIACNQSTIYLADYQQTKYTRDWGATWQILSTPINYTTGSGSYSVETSGNNVVIGSVHGVYVSHDDGQTWSLKPIPMGGIAWSVYINGNTIFAGMTNGLFKSFDSGNSWTQQMNLNNPNIISVEFFGNIGFISTIAGSGSSNPSLVYMSNNSGATWLYCNGGLDPSHDIWSFHRIGNMVYCGAGSAAQGIYRDFIGTFTSNAEVEKESFSFYPNPASDQISVQFLNSSFIGIQCVELISTSGAVVKKETIDSSALPVNLVLNCADLSRGLYVLRIYDEQTGAARYGKVTLN